jgi:hypothetical protein
LRSNFLSAASKFSASSVSVSRDAIRRAVLLYRAALQVLRQSARRKLYVAAAAVVVAGLAAGLVAALVPSGPAAGLAEAADTARAPHAAVRPSAPAAGSPAAQQAVRVQAAKPAKQAAKPAKQAAKPAKQAAKPAKQAKQAAKPYTMYDSVTPAQIPSGHPVATYANGSYAVSPSQVSGKQVIWIDTNGSAPTKASVLDVEPGDATPAGAAAWAKARLTANPHAPVRIYTMLSEWAAAKAAIATLPGWMQSHVKWWIADPTGVQHVVPGSNATQWYWGSSYDISTVNPGF